MHIVSCGMRMNSSICGLRHGTHGNQGAVLDMDMSRSIPCVSYAMRFMLCVCPVMRVHVSCIAIYVCTVSITVDMPPCEQSYP